jgi:hypothetical protein
MVVVCIFVIDLEVIEISRYGKKDDSSELICNVLLKDIFCISC